MTSSASSRITSLDQFRGYTVTGMILVNFLGGFVAVPAILRHHNTYCSYADTIMPHFLFAVGFALRLVMLKEREKHGIRSVTTRGLKRGLSLVLVGLILYQLDGNYRSWEELKALGWSGFFEHSFRRSGFQALTHIGVTTLWVLPVICLSGRVRLIYAVFSGLVHVGLSHLFWYETLHEWRVIDGGLLGFLTWTIPTIAGSFAYDWVKNDPKGALRPLLIWGLILMLLSYAISCLGGRVQWAAPPFFPPWDPVDMWTMSQRAGSLTYLAFSAGFSLVLYALFVVLVDLKGWQWSVFAEFGKNAFAAYIIHLMVLSAFERFAPGDAPLAYALAFTALGWLISWQMTCWCNDRGIILRL